MFCVYIHTLFYPLIHSSHTLSLSLSQAHAAVHFYTKFIDFYTVQQHPNGKMMGRTIMPAPQDAPVAGQQPQKIRQVWTPEEDQLLSEAVAMGKLNYHAL